MITLPQRWHRIAWPIVIGTLVILEPTHPAESQSETCVNTAINVVNPAELEPLLDSIGNCYVDGVPTSTAIIEGSWVKTASPSVLQGGTASTQGQCIPKGRQGPICQTYPTENRNVDVLWVGHSPGMIGNLPINNEPPPAGPHPSQQLDTTVLGTTNGPISRSTTQQAEYTFRWRVQTSGTSCGIQPLSHPQEFLTFNVIRCRPEWFIEEVDGEPVPLGFNYQAPPGPITIAVPSGYDAAYGPAASAAADWASRLGRQIQVLPNSTCPPGAGTCVGMREDHGTVPGDPPGCASLGTSSPTPTGAWTDTMYVRFSPGWRSSHVDRIRRTIAHELGHYFGLGNRLDPSCLFGDTVMGAPTGESCNDPAPLPAGTPLGPTVGDARPLTETTYGSGNRLVCGW
jgi:hypothetical protein